ncbi:HAD-IC family P-type ATPase [archaeon]|jgi:P-type Ca2+ transporter type 2C|nr:HAD-IC family P-type ATPase [archaeon]MBT4373328.1 HAD-IC family P-type ATPase [archaeon]MBT4531673.1 HAD-IC family P-type ATPase [archaeon]MBT7001149.1 HAD-IC family P-type ATPase [archaeon]MBT7282365.1 HAD-IC family P-type ATPase [archaeon]
MQKEEYAKTKDELFKELETSEKGLTDEQAEKRLEQYGKNKIKKTHKFRPLKIFLSQFKSFLIYILIFAAIISFLIQHYIDGFVISAIVLLNAIIGFFQQYKAEKSIQKLRELLIPKSQVMRAGRLVEVSSEVLVPGDIVILNPGDKINADCRIIESENLQTNEAILTGESLPINKNTKLISKKSEITEQKNILFTGTQVVRGSVKALVIKTGMQTEFGKIAKTLQKIEPQKTPMQKRLDKFSKQIGFVILGFVALIVVLGFFEHFNLIEMFFTAVALAVSAIPEGLPAVLTISFAISAVLMSKGNVIVRRLPAVESLGSVTVICSDKTGTMTHEEMEVQEIFSNNKFYLRDRDKILFKNKKIDFPQDKTLFQLIKTSILCNNARFEIIKDKYEIIGDPTEQALVRNSLDLGLNKKEMIEAEHSIKKFEFDSKRKMMSVVRDLGRSKVIYSKGAIEKILSVSGAELINGELIHLTSKRKNEILEQAKKMEQKALRVLAFAYKNIPKKIKPSEEGLIFLGIVGMLDPPRKEVKSAITQCKNAGIDIKMITGDSLLTASAIGEKIGIKGKAISGTDLDQMSDAELTKSINEIVIFARTTPHQKLRITKALQSQNQVVAITGDGINDALALKSADIGIAMGKRGTDVARDIADLVLIDDNFASLVQGVKQGRRTYDNIKKFTKYFLAVNFDEILLVATTLFLRLPLPLLPLQILWVNLITDSLPALSLVFENGEDVMKSKPRKEKSLLDGIWRYILLAGLFAFIASIAVYLLATSQNLSYAKITTLVLTTIILFELLFVYTCRSDKSLFKIGIFSNKWLNYSVLISIALHLALLYTPLGFVFGVVPLTFGDWLFILPFAVSGIFIFEVYKLIKR